MAINWYNNRFCSYYTIKTKHCKRLHFSLKCGIFPLGDYFMKERIKGSAFLLLATVIWGSAFVAQSVGMDHIGPFTFQAVRCAMAVIGLLPVIYLFDRPKKDGKTYLSRWIDKRLWLAGILCGIPLFLAVNLQQIGLIDTDAGKSAFLTAMYIIMVPLIGLFLKRKASPMIPFAVLLAAAGLYLLSCAGVAQINQGDLFLLGCALMFAIQIIVVDHFADSVDALRLNCIQSLVCTVLSAIAMVGTEQPTWQGISDCLVPLAYAGFLSLGAGYSLQILGQQRLEPTPASLIMSLESVFAVLFGCLLLHERLSANETIGCVLVFAAVILSQIPIKTKKQTP